MVLAAIFFSPATTRPAAMMLYPLAIGGVCIIASIIGTFFVKLGARKNIMGALYKGFIACGLVRRSRSGRSRRGIVGFGTEVPIGDRP